MIDLITTLGVVYLTGLLIFGRLIIGHYAYKHRHYGDRPDWGEGWICGWFPSLLWPGTVIAYLTLRIPFDKIPLRIGEERRFYIAEQKAEIKRLAEANEKLAKELKVM